MNPSVFRCLVFATCLSLGSGCATKTATNDPQEERPKVAAEAPVGSRVKKRTNAAPVSGATRQDIENAKVQQGLHQQGVANRAGG